MSKIFNLFDPYTAENIHPGFSIDCIILGFHKKKICVLLNKFGHSKLWQLPGGFMFKTENSEEAATRILEARTNQKKIKLYQFHLFSDIDRSYKNKTEDYSERYFGKNRDDLSEKHWIMQRFISLGYLSLVKYDQVEIQKNENDQVKWFEVNELPELYTDHLDIINTAIKYIRNFVSLIPIGYELLPDVFKISDLRIVYEFFSNKTLDRRNYQRKVLSSELVVKLDAKGCDNPYNAPNLYSFSEKLKNKKVKDFSPLY